MSEWVERSFHTQWAAGTEAPGREDSTQAGVAGAEPARGQGQGQSQGSDGTGL